MGTPRLCLALVIAAAGCTRCDDPRAPELWLGVPDAPLVRAYREGTELGTVAGPPALDAPVRALLLRSDGRVVVLQEPVEGSPPAPVPPAVLLSRDGARVLSFAGEDGAGARLFDAASPPWAAAEDVSGRIWVTGGLAPVVYASDGSLAAVADPLPFPTRGVAALSDGRVAVAYGVQDVAMYAPDGTVAESIAPALGPDCEGVDALLAEPGGTLVVATRRFGASSEGILLRMTLGPGTLVPVQDCSAPASLGPGIGSALLAADAWILMGPSLAPLAPQACARWVSADLASDGGCAAPGVHRGVTLLRR